jgi:hypothetical protein
VDDKGIVIIDNSLGWHEDHDSIRNYYNTVILTSQCYYVIMSMTLWYLANVADVIMIISHNHANILIMIAYDSVVILSW